VRAGAMKAGDLALGMEQWEAKAMAGCQGVCGCGGSCDVRSPDASPYQPQVPKTASTQQARPRTPPQSAPTPRTPPVASSDATERTGSPDLLPTDLNGLGVPTLLATAPVVGNAPMQGLGPGRWDLTLLGQAQGAIGGRFRQLGTPVLLGMPVPRRRGERCVPLKVNVEIIPTTEDYAKSLAEHEGWTIEDARGVVEILGEKHAEIAWFDLMEWRDPRGQLGTIGSRYFEAATPGDRVAFLNLASVEATGDGCLWRQIFLTAQQTVTRLDGTLEAAPFTREAILTPNHNMSGRVNRDIGEDGKDQDWGPYLTGEKKFVHDRHSRGFPGSEDNPAAGFCRNVQFLVQATVPADPLFETDGVICRRWGYEWKSDGKRGTLKVVIGPQLYAQKDCKGHKAKRNESVCK